MHRHRRLGAVLICIALSALATACDALKLSDQSPPRPKRPPVEQAAVEADENTEPPAAWHLEEPLPAVPFDDPVREIVITRDDVQPMEVVEIKEVPAPKYSIGKVGRPRELFRAKHLRLSDDVPMAKNRGIVEITDGPGFDAKTIEAVLIDFETGEVARFADAFRTHRQMGIAWGQRALPTGFNESVLIHPDGLAVPWVAEGTYKLLTEVIVNAGRREIFVFQKNEHWRENRQGTTYAHWTDLRKPPPKPTLSIPVPPWRFGNDDGGTFGHYGTDYFGAIRNVTARNDDISGTHDCARVEFVPDAPPRCIPRDDIILGEGWHLTHTTQSWIAYNEAKKEVQHLGFGCRLYDVSSTPRSVSPPRIDFECDDGMIVWSPERTVKLQNDGRGTSNPIQRHTQGLMGWWKRPRGTQNRKGALVYGAVADFATLRQLTVDCFELRSVSQHPRKLMVTRCTAEDLFLLNADRADLTPVASGRGCSKLAHWEASEDLWVYRCKNATGLIKWVEAVDFAANRRWRLPALRTGAGGHFRWIWVQSDPRMLVVVDETGRTDRLMAWDLL